MSDFKDDDVNYVIPDRDHVLMSSVLKGTVPELDESDVALENNEDLQAIIDNQLMIVLHSKNEFEPITGVVIGVQYDKTGIEAELRVEISDAINAVMTHSVERSAFFTHISLIKGDSEHQLNPRNSKEFEVIGARVTEVMPEKNMCVLLISLTDQPM